MTKSILNSLHAPRFNIFRKALPAVLLACGISSASSWTSGTGIITTDGSVGIGTTQPNAKLDVNGYGWVRNRFFVEGDQSGQEALVVDQKQNGHIAQFRKNGTVKATIDENGNLGVGTGSPSEKFEVVGNVKVSGALKIGSSGWSIQAPDYVFEKGYKLERLDKVEAYIQKNKHLPEIPSAKQMEKEGMNLAEMNLRLLKKIEELTLHVIEQNKRISKLESKVSR